MHRLVRFTFILLSACGAAVSELPDAPLLDDAADPVAIDAGDAPAPDAATARCDLAKPFAPPVVAVRLDSVFDEAALTLTRNERIALLGRENTGTPPSVILQVTRATQSAPFEPPTATPLAQVNDAPGTEHHPSITGDGLAVYFERRSGAATGIFVGVRIDLASPFSSGSAVTIDGVALTQASAPTISGDGQTLYWLDGATQLLMSATNTGGVAGFGPAIAASTVAVASPVLSDDRLTLLYGQAGQILTTTRFSTTDAFVPGVAIPEVNSTEADAPLYLTSDGCVLFLKSRRPGGAGGVDIWIAERPL
jgi:hypothetical protein